MYYSWEDGKGQRSEVRDRKSDMETKQIKSAKDLRVYKKAYALAMEVFHISKQWPSEERFSLTSDIRYLETAELGSIFS